MGLTNEQILEIMEKNNGILEVPTLSTYDISAKKMQRLAQSGEIEKIGKGLYLHPDYLKDEYYIMALRVPKGVFSYESALYLHKLSDENPIKLNMTILSGSSNRLLKNKEKYNFCYLKKELWKLGQEKIKTPYGNEVTVYSKERTLAEMIGKIEKMDRNLILQALQTGLRNHILDNTKLLKYADIFKSKDLMRIYLEAIG